MGMGKGGDHRATATPSGQPAHVADSGVKRGTKRRTESRHRDACRAGGQKGCTHLDRRPLEKTLSRPGSAADIGLNLAKSGDDIGAVIVKPTVGPHDAASDKHDNPQASTGCAIKLNLVNAFGHDVSPLTDNSWIPTRMGALDH